MSSIPTKQIDGDVAVGRNVSAGGKATIRGSVTIGHNLKVDGWLDAPNIKGTNKGLFESPESLRSAYPNPADGWWAIVSNDNTDASKYMGRVYMGRGGMWVACVNADGTAKYGGNPELDSSSFTEEVEQITGDLDQVKQDVQTNARNITALQTTQTSQGNTINTHSTEIDGLKSRASTIEGNITALQTTHDAFENTKGKSNGLASLDASGKVPSTQLPGYVDDVIEFNAIVNGVTIEDGILATHKSSDTGCMVVYDKVKNRFLLAVAIASTTGLDWGSVIRPTKAPSKLDFGVEAADKGTINPDFWAYDGEVVVIKQDAFRYYYLWTDATVFGTSTAEGVKPDTGKIYTCTSDNKTFRWSGSELVAIGSDLALGTTALTAFRGDYGQEAYDLARGVKILPFDGYTEDIDANLGDFKPGDVIFDQATKLFYRITEDGIYVNAELPYNYGPAFGWCDTSYIYRKGTELFRMVCKGDTYVFEAYVIGESRFKELEAYAQKGGSVIILDEFLNTPVLVEEALLYQYQPTDRIVFDPNRNRLLIKRTEGNSTGKPQDLYYRGATQGAEFIGTATADGIMPYTDKIYINRAEDKTYRWSGSELVEVGGGSIIGNTYNLTEAYPLAAGLYYADIKADNFKESIEEEPTLDPIQKAIDAGVIVIGRAITYAVGEGKWVTYQYVGQNLIPSTIRNTKNWDNISGGSTTGNTINVHEITGKWDYLTLGLALPQIPETIRTPGRRITFMRQSGEWQTWQFTGNSKDQWQGDYWKPSIQTVEFNGKAQSIDENGKIDIEYQVEVDTALDADSERPIANKAVAEELDKVEKAATHEFTFDAANRLLTITDGNGNEQSVMIPGGGGGDNINPTAISLTILSPMADKVKEGDDYTLEFLWRHYNITTNVDTQYGGTAELQVGGSTVDRMEVTQGQCSFNVGKWLRSGTNSVRVVIKSDDGLVSNSPVVKITAVTLGLTSPYKIETATPKGEAVAFRYVVNGSGTKTVRFTLDGNEIATKTVESSGAVSVQSIPTSALSHGAHRLTVQAENQISDTQTLRSNILAYDLMIVEEGNTKPIIAVAVPTPTIDQYETVEIPYAVYDPSNAQRAKVQVSLNGKTIESATVDRSAKTLSYRAKESGTLNFVFTCGTTTKSVPIEVRPAAQQVTAETDALALYLTASGRSNDSDDADNWAYTSESGQTTKAEFYGCGFNSQSGWIKDKNGLTALHLEKGATCVIPYKPFASDAKLTGKTIEIEYLVSNCYDTDATLISCLAGNVGFEIKAQDAYMRSALGKTVESKFKQDERIRVGFQVEQTGGNRFMYIFLNGKMSGVVQYDTADRFSQNPATGITLGHPSCELNVYNIRVYDNVLSFRQMVNNYIADMDDTDVMFRKLEENNILNEDATETDIDYEKAVKKIPCMTFIGELPKFKGDKKKNTKIIYEDRLHPEYSFVIDKAQNDVQGTSSQYYPRKNWKFKALVPFTMSQTGQSVSKYALRGLDGFGKLVAQKAVKTFCLKADFAESSGSHNTGAANFIHEILKGAGILTPMQEVDETVRTTIYGFPILMFHQESESAPRKFIGKYNFNNDKSTHDTFGFQDISGFNKGMVNRDDYLVYKGTFEQLQADTEAQAKYESEGVSYYLIDLSEGRANPYHNHLVALVDGQWVDKGELWRWKVHLLAWAKNDGTTCTRAQGIMAKVEAGELVENNVECWEFLNNGHPMCLMHESDYTRRNYDVDSFPKWVDATNCLTDDKGKYAPYWTGAFEPRYPDNDDLNRQYAQGKIPEQIKRLTDWLVSLDLRGNLTDEQKKAKGITFANQVSGYFNKKMMLAYDILRELIVMADQGAKNMMWAIIDGIGYIIFYDNDTIWLINNEGRLMFIPYVEPHDKDRLGKYVFNGESSNLWNLIEVSPLQAEKNDLFNTMVSQGGMTYDRALLWFNTRQSDQWSETVFNADSKYKYIDSFGKVGEDGTGTPQDYLDIAQGSREEHRKWAMFERFQYMNAKYCTGTYRDSYVALRANTAGESTVPDKVEVSIKAAQDWYYGFRFAATAGYSSRRVEKGEWSTFQAPEGSKPNDTECYIHQADRISDIQGLPTLYPTTLQVGACKMLENLVVGDKTPGYKGKLANLTLGTHPLLRYVNICNIPTLQTTLNLEGCSALDEVEAQGSGITAVNLPKGSTISKLHLPETVVSLTFENLPNLTNANLTIDDYSNINTVDIMDCDKLNPMGIVANVTASAENKLQYLRVGGVTLKGTGIELLQLIEQGVRGITNESTKPEVYGTYQLMRLPQTGMMETITEGIAGIDLILVVEAFTDAMDEVNAESPNVASEVDTVTLDNIDEHLLYYNGESAFEYISGQLQRDMSIHELIQL